MILSFSTIFTTTLTCSILIFVFYFILNNIKLINSIHYLSLLFIGSIIGLRLLLPVEFFFTKTIPITVGINQINKFVYYELTQLGSTPLRIYHLLLVIWGTGFMIKICSYVNNIYKLKKIIHCSENVIDDYKKIFPYLNKSSVTGVYYFQNITQPTTFFLKKSVIFLPPIQYEIQELNYIFLHELMHIKNKDILIKYLLLLLSALYWWLPLIHRFQKDITLLLELRVDSQICHDLSEKEKNDYIKSLVLVAQKINKHNNVKFHPLGTSFIIREQNTLTKRINFYLDDVTERKKAIIVITFSFFITLSFPSIVIEPYHQPQEIENTWSESKFIKQHFIQANIDGSYSLIEKGSNIEISKITNINIEPFNKMKIFPEDKKK